MVIINEAVVRREMNERGWGERQLVGVMDVAENTVRNVLAGEPLSHSTQVALYNAFGGSVPVEELFVVVMENEKHAVHAVQEAVA